MTDVMTALSLRADVWERLSPIARRFPGGIFRSIVDIVVDWYYVVALSFHEASDVVYM